MLFVMLGGALGASARYALSEAIYAWVGVSFPWATLCVNSLGSFFMGFLWSLFQTTALPGSWRVFALVGFLGSFTTFSTFSFENLELMRNNEHHLALINMVISVVGGLILVYLGFLAGKQIFSFAK